MRSAMILAAAISVFPALAMSATGARADEWCGYAARAKATIECGYSTVADCESAIGKGGMCFVDPELARNFTRAAPALPHPDAAAQRPETDDRSRG